MKHFILTLSLLVGAMVFAPASMTASVAAPVNQSVTDMTKSTPAAIDLDQMGSQKGGFFQKLMAKRMVKKIAKALGAGSDDGRTVAILAYLTLIGFVVALVMHMGDKKTSLGGFHLAQVLGNAIFMIVFGIIWIIPILGWIIGGVVFILGLINWISGLISAVNEKEKTMPIFGKLFDKWFRGIFD